MVNQNTTMIELKKGDIVKHFEGKSLIEKEIYEIVAVNPSYTGTKTFPDEAVVIYESIFNKGKAFVKEYAEFIRVLNDDEIKLSGGTQFHVVEPLTEEEFITIKTSVFLTAKQSYLLIKEQQDNNQKAL